MAKYKLCCVFISLAASLCLVNGELQFTSIPTDAQVYEGDSIVLKCSAYSKDDIEYSWSLNGNEIQLNNRVYLNGSNLHIIAVSKALDSGDYVCTVTSKSSGARMETPPAHLDVFLYPIPSVQLLKKDKNNLHFVCHIDGILPDHYQIFWYKNDEKLDTDAHIVLQNGKLHIKNTSPKDNGIYGCAIYMQSLVVKSEQNYRFKFSSHEISIKNICAKDKFKLLCRGKRGGDDAKESTTEAAILRFTPKPTSKNLELGSVGKVHCKAVGTPSPTIKWMLEDGNELPETIEDVNGTLTFKNVSADHKGNYTCLATNVQENISATVQITIVVAPRFEIAPEGQLYVTEMGSAFIHCVPSGDPKPTLQWDKDLQYLHSGNSTDDERIKILENGTLFLSEVHYEDEGKYGCTIGNSAGLKREEVQLFVRSAESVPTSDEIAEDDLLITRAVLITMSVAFTYIVLVFGLMLWCRHRRNARKARLNEAVKENGDADIKNGEIEPCLPEKEKSAGKEKKRPKESDGQEKSDDTVNSSKSKKSTNSTSYLDQLSLPRSSLSDLIQIGKCDFGDVLIGKIKASECKSDIKEENNEEKAEMNTENEKAPTKKISNEELNEIKSETDYKLVLVKALTKVKDENACSEFRRQIDLFRAVSTKNVAKLFGLCRDKDPHYMILEYTDWGDLKQFLLATAPVDTDHTKTANSKPPPLKIPQILALAHQIGRGMDAIYKARIIHKDLATRNCLISSDFSAKISLPCLCKDKYSKEYFKHRNQLVPLRWMSPESIQDDDWSIKSDVFSFGVLVWELFTQSVELPFKDMSNDEFLNSAQNGKLEWKLAENTPTELHKILLSCWTANPKERPSFSQLVVAIGNCLQSEYPNEPKD